MASIEKKLLRYILEHEDVYTKLCDRNVASFLFTEEAANEVNRPSILFNLIIGYYSEYGKPLTRDALPTYIGLQEGLKASAVDILSLFDELALNPYTESVDLLINALKESYKRYQCKLALDNSILKFNSNDVDGCMDTLRNDFNKVEADITEDTHTVSLGDESESDLISRLTGGTTRGVLTGYKTLDKVTRGFHGGQLIVVSSGTGEGKTTFIQNIAYNAWMLYKKNVLYVSIENYVQSIKDRMLAMSTGIPMDVIKEGRLNNTELDKVHAELARRKKNTNLLTIVERGENCTPAFIDAQLQAIHPRKYDLLLVDYLQIMSLDGKRKEKDHTYFADLAVRLRAVARKYNVPVITPSQINRAGAKPDPKAKKIPDEYDSYSDAMSQFITNTADIRISLRAVDPELVRHGADVFDIKGSLTKHRDGKKASFILKADMARQRMQEIQQEVLPDKPEERPAPLALSREDLTQGNMF